jgi:quercetin dioxygenase-like cupin family protein
VVGVVGRVLVREGPDPAHPDLLVAQLRFAEHATIHPHAGERDTIVVCVEGEGFTSVGEDGSPLREGQQVRWPRGVVHRLWTEDSTMTTLMIERRD